MMIDYIEYLNQVINAIKFFNKDVIPRDCALDYIRDNYNKNINTKVIDNIFIANGYTIQKRLTKRWKNRKILCYVKIKN